MECHFIINVVNFRYVDLELPVYHVGYFRMIIQVSKIDLKKHRYFFKKA